MTKPVSPKTGYITTRDGIRVPVNKIEKIRDAVEAVYQESVLETYEGPDPRFWGKTKLEVAAILAADRMAKGDPVEFHKMMDRILGTPKSSSENININAKASLGELLDAMGKKNGIDPVPDSDVEPPENE